MKKNVLVMILSALTAHANFAFASYPSEIPVPDACMSILAEGTYHAINDEKTFDKKYQLGSYYQRHFCRIANTAINDDNHLAWHSKNCDQAADKSTFDFEQTITAMKSIDKKFLKNFHRCNMNVANKFLGSNPVMCEFTPYDKNGVNKPSFTNVHIYVDQKYYIKRKADEVFMVHDFEFTTQNLKFASSKNMFPQDTIPHNLYHGDYRFTYRVRDVNKPASVQGQAHLPDGTYQAFSCTLGDKSNIATDLPAIVEKPTEVEDCEQIRMQALDKRLITEHQYMAFLADNTVPVFKNNRMIAERMCIQNNPGAF